MNSGSKCLLLHIVPADGIGGVEVAARSGATSGGGLLRTHFLAGSGPSGGDGPISHGGAASPFSPAAIRAAVRQVRRLDPDVVLFSLWQSLFAFLAVKLLFPRKKTAVFLHCDRRVHAADAIATRTMIALADAVWGDSRQALADVQARADTKVISFVLDHRPVDDRDPETFRFEPRFIAWSRLSREKRIDLALELIARLNRIGIAAHFTIVGPDGGCLDALRHQVERLGIAGRVEFLGPRSHGEIPDLASSATFYLQLSDFEGQALAVVEAMQLGLIPVVTPVGAIADYCSDGGNAILFDGLEQTAARLRDLLEQPAKMASMSAAARRQFESAPLYHDDLIAAAGELARRPR